jgi:hypothetical protein
VAGFLEMRFRGEISIQLNRETLKAEKFLILGFLVSAILFGYGMLTRLPPPALSSQYFPPPPFVEHLHFGERWALSDLMWIRAIQDFDYCEVSKDSAQASCIGNTWLYHMIEALTELDPQHIEAHQAGALSLSVLVGDVPGSSKIFKKTIERFPKSWKILSQAAFHELLEAKNPELAATYLQKAGELGAPGWVYSLATRLYSRAGKLEAAERLYQDLQMQGFDEKLLNRMKSHIIENTK